MADAVISRTGGGSESVTLSVVNNRDGLAVARDVGKPNINLYETGTEDPQPQDNLSALDNFTVIGELSGSSAYSDAQTLVEDIIKRRPQSSDKIQLNLTDLPSGQTHDVAAIADQAVRVTYNPGVRQRVLVQLSLQVVDSVNGGTQTAQSNLSPDAGSGVKITDGSNPVTITNDLSVTREAGRGAGNVVGQPSDLPVYFDLNKPAIDTFEISGELRGVTAESDAQTLEETLVRARQGTSSLELHFLGNEYGLDAYPVMPSGSRSLRTTFSVGETDTIAIPTLNLQVVDTS